MPVNVECIKCDGFVHCCYQVQGTTDTKNFDDYPEEKDEAPEETSDWDKAFAELF